ncbi:MAG TPA: hypothetical protein VF914_08870 [Chloroflexia bacterium]|jgi:hypothetical protein
MAHTVLLELPDDVYKLLAQTAEQTSQPLEELAVEWLAMAGRIIQNDPLEKYIGAFTSKMPGWAERHDELLGGALMDDHRSEE